MSPGRVHTVPCMHPTTTGLESSMWLSQAKPQLNPQDVAFRGCRLQVSLGRPSQPPADPAAMVGDATQIQNSGGYLALAPCTHGSGRVFLFFLFFKNSSLITTRRRARNPAQPSLDFSASNFDRRRLNPPRGPRRMASSTGQAVRFPSRKTKGCGEKSGESTHHSRPWTSPLVCRPGKTGKSHSTPTLAPLLAGRAHEPPNLIPSSLIGLFVPLGGLQPEEFAGTVHRLWSGLAAAPPRPSRR